MTTEPEPTGDAKATPRKFDDVASLFGSIVPAPGSPIRPARPLRPLPTALPQPPAAAAGSVPSPATIPFPPPRPAPVVPPPVPDDEAPGAEPAAESPAPVPPPLESRRPELRPSELRPPELRAPELRLVPPPPLPPRAAPRVRPPEIPWPDAFEPRPNFRKREPRNWSWLLLIPAGLVAAVAIMTVDVRSARTWIDANVLHRTPDPAMTDSPLLPAPFRRNGTADTPQAASDAPIPYPALPTSPAPTPAGADVSPPPVDPTQAASAAAAAPPIHVTIQYRRNIPGADGEARRLAALLQSTGGSVELRPAATTAPSPTITYYNGIDKPSATALALILGNEAASWTVRLGTAKNPPGSIDIAMP